MNNIDFTDTNIHNFAYYGKEGVDFLERVDVEKAADELFSLVRNYDKAFSNRLYKKIQKGSVGAETLKKQIAALVDLSWKTILTNKTFDEVKVENPNIKNEVNEVLNGIIGADYDDFYIFFDFLNMHCSQDAETIFNKELKLPALYDFEEGFITVLYNLKEWLGLSWKDDLFNDDNERSDDLGRAFDDGDKDLYVAFSGDYEEEDDPRDYAYREMSYDHFHRC